LTIDAQKILTNDSDRVIQRAKGKRMEKIDDQKKDNDARLVVVE